MGTCRLQNPAIFKDCGTVLKIIFMGLFHEKQETSVKQPLPAQSNSPVPPQGSSDPRTEATRQDLLQAGAVVFARDGLKQARMRDIAATAQTHLSAINYHFGSKEGLYQAVLQHMAQQRLEAFPLPDASVSPNLQTELEQLIRNLLGRFIEPGGMPLVARLMAAEVLHPTAALDLIVQRISRPQLEQINRFLRTALGSDISDDELRAWSLSLLGQCTIYLFARPMLERLFPTLYPQLDLDQLARHICQVMMSGMQGARTGSRHSIAGSNDEK